MDEETSKKIHRKKARKEQETKQRSFADKLKTEKDKRTYVGEKLRNGKKDVSESRAEFLENTRIKKQSRAKSLQRTYEIAAEAKRKVVQVNNADSTQDNKQDVSTDVTSQILNESEFAIQDTLTSNRQKYSKKLHANKRTNKSPNKIDPSPKNGGDLGERGGKLNHSPKVSKDTEMGNDLPANKSQIVQKLRLKAKIQREGYEANAARKGEWFVERTRIGDSIKAFINNIEQKAVEWIAENPIGAVLALVGLIIVLVVCGTMSSCSMIGGGSSDAAVVTTFTAHDEDILAVDDDYIELEEALQEFIDDYETNNPGYDDYEYELDEIGHNPFELAALLTVLYEDYKEDEVKEMIKVIFEMQYTITETEKTEPRTKIIYNEETGEDEEVEYDAIIRVLTITNNSIDEVARSIGLDEDELVRYELLLETYGNKKYLFEDDIYAIINSGEYEDYKIPAEYLTDAEFAKLIHEAEKYLGMEYVWGGSKPSEGFDCSGFVSYVINHSGNGINVGRPTANGLVNKCAKISSNNAKPGDLIFFKNTYKGAPSGASHVGIYVGNGMMIHCGNPIQYTSVETPFWQNHLYTYGRLDH